MDTTGTFEIAIMLSKYSCYTAIHKRYSLDDWKEFGIKNPETL
jgi:GMP reductase